MCKNESIRPNKMGDGTSKTTSANGSDFSPTAKLTKEQRVWILAREYARKWSRYSSNHTLSELLYEYYQEAQKEKD